MLYYHSFIFNSSFFQVFYEFLRTFFYRSFSLSCFCFCDKILVMKKNRQKIIKYEKTLLLWIPFLIILAAVAVLIPQVTKILDRGRMYSITENIGELVPVVPESQIISEVKVNQELAPQEAFAMLEKAGHHLRMTSAQDAAYFSIISTCGSYRLEDINEVLSDMGIPELGSRQK